MRPIDADALDDEMYRKSFEVDDGRNVWNSGLWIRYKIYEEASKDAPTVDAEPARHGHWIFNPKDAIEMMFTLPKCSVCGAESPNGGNYCPNCGAKMDEGKENETDDV